MPAAGPLVPLAAAGGPGRHYGKPAPVRQCARPARGEARREARAAGDGGARDLDRRCRPGYGRWTLQRPTGERMATVNLSVPEEVEAAFNEAFEGRNESAVIAGLKREAVERVRRKQRSREAIERIPHRRRQAPAASGGGLRIDAGGRASTIAVKSAAYYDRRWAISRIPPGAVVFLYHTGVGVIAKGKATSGYKGISQNPAQVSGSFRNSLNLMCQRGHDGSPEAISRTSHKIADFNQNEGEEFHVPLEFYWSLEEDEWRQEPTATKINLRLGTGHRFRQSMFAIGEEMARTIDDIAKEKGVFQPVIPAKAGIQGTLHEMDSRFRGNDGLSRGRCPGFRRPGIAGRTPCVVRREKARPAGARQRAQRSS